MSLDPTRGIKLKYMIGGFAIGAVVAFAVYYAALYPWPRAQEAAGTMGGVQKADRYRSEQMSESTIATEVPTSAQYREQMQRILQRIDTAKLMKAAAVDQSVQAINASGFLNTPGMQSMIQNAVAASCQASGVVICNNPGFISGMEQSVQAGIQNAVGYQVQAALQNAFLMTCQSTLDNVLKSNVAMQGAISDPKAQAFFAQSLESGLVGVLGQAAMQKLLMEQAVGVVGATFNDKALMTGMGQQVANACGVFMQQNKDGLGVGAAALSPQLQAAVAQNVQSAVGVVWRGGAVGAAGAVGAVGAVGATGAVGALGDVQATALANMQGILMSNAVGALAGSQAYGAMANGVLASANSFLQSSGIVIR
ncbi:MAG: hypothetical protein AB1714_29335 [Acidobacteriota bacterium]